MSLYFSININPPNHQINPLQMYKKLNWSKDQDDECKHVGESCLGLPSHMLFLLEKLVNAKDTPFLGKQHNSL